MTRPQIVRCLLLSSVAAFGCAHETSEPLTPASGTVSRPAIETDSPVLTDTQVLGALSVINSIEVQQGKMALRLAQREQVHDFASLMVEHHTQALFDLQALETRTGLSPTGSETASDLRADNTKLMTRLNERKLVEFDQAYIEAQVEGHQAALTLLDDKLIPSVINPDVKQYLQTMRPRVKAHLDRARALEELFD